MEYIYVNGVLVEMAKAPVLEQFKYMEGPLATVVMVVFWGAMILGTIFAAREALK